MATKTYYCSTSQDVLAQLESSRNGLSPAEAKRRLEDNGPNQLDTTRREPTALKCLRQFKDPMIILLVVSSALSFFLGDPRVGFILVLLTLFNTTIGFLQEFRAEKLMKSLEKLVVPQAKVVRDGALEEINSSELVVGDIVYVEEGNLVPSDLRVVEETGLRTNDFALTGESNPSRKFSRVIPAEVPLAERHNLVFMGTTVATGNGYGVIIGTGLQTELGRIASLSRETKAEASPLQKEMGHIARRVTQGTVLLCLVLVPIALFSGGLDLRAALFFAIGIAASIIPQGLPAEINTALAQAASKLAGSGALVKKLSAVETLGATTVICTDKTGTLTENQMTVERLMIGRTNYMITGGGYAPEGSILGTHGEPMDQKQLGDLQLFFDASVMSSNASVRPSDDEHATYYAIGDPTEAALITMSGKASVTQEATNTAYPEVKEFSFDSARKRMSSVRQYGSGKQLYLFVKGAPEEVLAKCTDIWDHGHTRKMATGDKKFIKNHSETLATEALRNLGIAYRVLPADTKLHDLSLEDAEQKLTWLGMASMIDPLRTQVPAAMHAAHAAHINVAVITGDHAITAEAIAKRAHLAATGQDIMVVSGEKLKDLADKAVVTLVKRGGVIFSRVAPEDKLRIVSLAQKAGQVVAVTGDGINDAPALKRADIGVAMGKTGTDVAKQSAEIVLVDDSFSTLVGAIQQGRAIFQNIKKATLSCFTSNAAELVVNLVSLAALSLFSVPIALSVMQILAIDLMAELFPIAALGRDKAEGDIMKAKPRRLQDHILNHNSITDLIWCGLLIGGFAFANYIMFFSRHGISPGDVPAGTPIHLKAMSLTYLTIVLCQLLNILQRRSTHGLFTRYQLHNRQLWLAIGLSLLCVITIIYVPFIRPYFQTGPLGFVDWLYALAAAGTFIAIREFQRYDRQHHRHAIHALHLSVASKR